MSIALPQDSVHEFNPYTKQGSGFTFETHNEGDYMLTSPTHAARTARHGTDGTARHTNKHRYAFSRAMSVYNHADKSLYATLRKNARAAVLDSVTVCKAYLRVRLHSQSPQWWTAGPAGRHALGLISAAASSRAAA